MKQKIVMKVQMTCQKCRTKARKIAASSEGVEEMKLEGEDKNQVVVIGDGVDSVRLVNCLRRRVGHTYIISVDEVKPPPPPPPPSPSPSPPEDIPDPPQLGFEYHYPSQLVGYGIIYEPIYEPFPTYNCCLM